MSIGMSLILAVIAGMLYLTRRLCGDVMLERPIVVCPLIGLILGDYQTGLALGATFELIFMGAQTIGGSVPTNMVVASVLGTAFTITTGQGTEQALLVAIPAGVVSSTFEIFAKTVVSVVLARADKYADNGNSKGISFMFFVGNFIHFLAYSVPVFVAIYFGMDAVAGLTESIPENIMNGITAVGNVLPAIGFAMLLNSLGDKKLFPFFFAGFLIVAYLPAVNVIGVAAIGAIIGLLYVFNDKDEEKSDSVF